MSLPVVVSFPDLGLSDAVIDVTHDSSVGDLVKLCGQYWGISGSLFDLEFEGSSCLSPTVKVTNLGVTSGSELIANKKSSITVTLSDLKERFDELTSVFKQNPSLVCVIDVSTMTDKCGRLSSDIPWKDVIPQTVGAVSFINTSPVTEIGEKFLCGCSITRLDLSGFTNVAYVDYQFLSDCVNLIEVDLSPMSSLSSVGYSFMSGCSSLQKVNVDPMRNFVGIEFSFLSGCASLVKIDFPKCSVVECIGSSFLKGCESLTGIDLSSFSKVSMIGHSFLSGCSSLRVLDLSPLFEVDRIECHSFLSHCPHLKEKADSFLNSIAYRRQVTLAAGCKPIESPLLYRSSSFNTSPH
eukprot:TRINITY_DN8075_c0_g1_i1.p1 TRINITY_DN8075_c0_g1~~TRINITY_DN8075_c0_g1_i1.p1  ORF type:complete len:352 (+),score=46.65 TRINITY_DN8075_c0_g1_i1:37-1092(+)